MTFSFDDILAATESNGNGGANIVSEQHDASKIHVDENAIRQEVNNRGGVPVWDAYEYGLSADQAQAALDNADTPEAREAVMDDLRARAIARANLATNRGRICLMVAGDPAWSRLGVQVSSAVNSKDAVNLSSLAGWDLRKVEHMLEWNGEKIATGCFSIVRIVDGEMINLTNGKTVGQGYTIVSNEDVFSILDAMGDKVRYESAGAIGNGSTVFMLTDIPGSYFEALPGDVVEGKLMASATHDGSGSIKIMPTTNRPECANTYSTCMLDWRKNKRLGRTISIRHTKNAANRMRQAEKAIHMVQDSLAAFGETAQQMARTEFGQPKLYFENVLDVALSTTVAEERVTRESIGTGKVLEAICEIQDRGERGKAEASYRRAVKRREGLLDEILNRYESETCQGSTAWSAWNAVTETVDHGGMFGYQGDERKRAETRMDKVLDGQGADLKDTALEMVLEMAQA